MPLEEKPTEKAKRRNIAQLRREGFPRDQAVAIAEDKQREARKDKERKKNQS